MTHEPKLKKMAPAQHLTALDEKLSELTEEEFSSAFNRASKIFLQNGGRFPAKCTPDEILRAKTMLDDFFKNTDRDDAG